MPLATETLLPPDALYPIDLVEAGLANPNDLTADQLTGGVIYMDVYSSDVPVDRDGKIERVETPSGAFLPPPGLIFRVHEASEKGIPTEPTFAYVDNENHLKPLVFGEDGAMPPEVTDRMIAEAESHRQVTRQYEPETVYGRTMRLNGSFVEFTPTAPLDFTVVDQEKLITRLAKEDAAVTMASIKARVEQATNRSVLHRVARGAASLALSVLGKKTKTGRHHQSHRPNFAQ